MVAKQIQHYEADTLRELLDERLSLPEAQQVEHHLSNCDSCRLQLAELAGEPSWWNETAEVLNHSRLAAPADKSAWRSQVKPSDSVFPLDSLDASLDWIRPLLHPLSPQTPHQNALGQLDQYIVKGVIGQGGMGVVLQGIDPELNRPVAIKVLAPYLAGVGAARARFMREAQAAAAIVHPSIVPIYSVVPTARLPYLVMPSIGGGNLQQRLDREGPLELIEVLRIGLQIAEGLTAAHKHAVIHRDIKPANILVEEGNGRVLISDFGLARALDDATLTNSGMIAGTPQYMSPEQARGEPVDVRSDLFSMGSLLYALATGRPPFRAETPLGVLRKITETRAKPIHEVNERVPAWFDVLVNRFMEPELSRRIESAEVAVTLLRAAHAHVRNPSVNKLPSTLRQEHPWRRIGALIASLCALVVAWMCLANSTTDKSQERAIPVQQTAPFVSAENAAAGVPNIMMHPDVSTDWSASEIHSELRSIQAVLDELSSQLGEPDAW